MTEPTKDRVQELLDGIMSYIRDARGIINKGDFIELGGLDKRVQELCEAIQGLTVEDSMFFKGDLDNMMTELNMLQDEFKKMRESLGGELNDAGKHQQAAKAYKQSEGAAAREGTASSSDTEAGDSA